MESMSDMRHHLAKSFSRLRPSFGKSRPSDAEPAELKAGERSSDERQFASKQAGRS
jgi:hypothetical protein